MENLRKWGCKPFNVAVVHGGPGAAGEMAIVARELSYNTGVLEPLQTKCSVETQVEELKETVTEHGDLPITLIGFSWGAWLSYLVAARYPLLAKKLILVSSSPFEDSYASHISETRLSMLSSQEKEEAVSLMRSLGSCSSTDSKALAHFGEMMLKADSYDPVAGEGVSPECDANIYMGVWKEASGLRSSGELLKLARGIRCPVVAVHGDYDPHPAEGVREPLSNLITDCRFVLLEECGHCPWLERHARERFYDILRSEIPG